MANKNDKESLLMYRGKPLVRSGNVMYYGDMADAYVAMLQIQDTEGFEDLTLPKKVSVQIWSTDESLPPLQRIKKRADKGSLYEAINIASIWLERYLNDSASN